MVECFLRSVGRVLLSFAISTPLRTVYDNIEMQCSIFQLLFLLSSIILYPLATVRLFLHPISRGTCQFFSMESRNKARLSDIRRQKMFIH
jgi:hypothetical protein